MQILDGKLVAQSIYQELQGRLLNSKSKRPPNLVAILVGNDPASATYVHAKMKACEQVGFGSKNYHLPDNTQEKEVLDLIAELNQDDAVDGFLVQLPLPVHINAERVMMAIDPAKDVDGFHPVNIGKMTLYMDGIKPATPSGIIELIKYYQIETSGKHCVVIGRSNIVGTPISLLLSQNANPGNCTVTICHTRTKDLAEQTRKADILIAAAGRSKLVTADMIKPGAVVIDVGIHRLLDENTGKYRLVGDVDFEGIKEKCSAITRVPGGVGPLTIAALLKNTYQAYQKNQLSR